MFTFLSDMNNLEKLMPEQVVNWKSDADSCTYTIKGMADIGMRISERVPSSRIVMVSEGKVPFDFTLSIDIAAAGNGSETSLRFEGDVNMFLRMMVEKPLGNFFNMLIDSLEKQF